MRYFSEVISGAVNDIVFGEGLTSIQAEPKTLVNVMLVMSSQKSNWVEGWFEREQQLTINDYILPTNLFHYRYYVDINYSIPIGKTWKLALRCGADGNVLYGVYGYEIG